MDEITLVTAIAPPAPELPTSVRDAARATLLAEIATERVKGTTPGRATGPRRRAAAQRSRRLARWGIAGAGLAAAAASAAIMLPSVLAGSPGRPAPEGPGAGGHQPMTARAVLLRAAQATAAIPDLHPRADQFIYTDSVTRYMTHRLFVTRAWLSVDGWHGGLILQRWASGKRWYHGFGLPDCLTLPHSNWNYKANCPLPPAYVTNLPRTVKAMKRYLLGYYAHGKGSPPAADAIGTVTGFYQFLVPHRASALMFRALSQIKGIRVIDHATTLAGDKGIAVAAYDPSRGTLDELIFDPKTYLYIGDSQIALNSTYMPKGTVNGNAVLQIAVVDKAGQLP